MLAEHHLHSEVFMLHLLEAEPHPQKNQKECTWLKALHSATNWRKAKVS